MAIFSPKAKRLIDAAVADIGDEEQKAVWFTWASANASLRGPGLSWQGTAGTLPVEVATIALYALENMIKWKRARREMKDLSEDELSALDNDISHAKSVEMFLFQAAAQGVAQAAPRH